jgi:hypothetical protein
MFTRSKIVLSLALVLGTASAGMAASKQPVHHPRTSVVHHVMAGTRGNAASGGSAYGYATPFPAHMRNGGSSFQSSGEGTIAN